MSIHKRPDATMPCLSDEQLEVIGEGCDWWERSCCDIEGVVYAYAKSYAKPLVESLKEIINLCELGDIDENTEAYGWGKAFAAAKAALAHAHGVDA